MKSNFFITKNVCTVSLDPEDQFLDQFATKILNSIRKKKISDVIINLDQFEFVTSETIEFISKTVNVLNLNNIRSIVCGFNVQTASVIFHFIEKVEFQTTLDVQRALDVIESR